MFERPKSTSFLFANEFDKYYTKYQTMGKHTFILIITIYLFLLSFEKSKCAMNNSKINKQTNNQRKLKNEYVWKIIWMMQRKFRSYYIKSDIKQFKFQSALKRYANRSSTKPQIPTTKTFIPLGDVKIVVICFILPEIQKNSNVLQKTISLTIIIVIIITIRLSLTGICFFP